MKVAVVACAVELPGSFGDLDRRVDIEQVGQRHQRPEGERMTGLVRRRVRSLVDRQRKRTLELPAIRDEIRAPRDRLRVQHPIVRQRRDVGEHPVRSLEPTRSL